MSFFFVYFGGRTSFPWMENKHLMNWQNPVWMSQFFMTSCKKPWHLRPQVASNVHLVRRTMSERPTCISLKLRPLSYKHQTGSPLIDNAASGHPCWRRCPRVDGTVDACWYGPDLLEKPKFSMGGSCWQLMSKGQQLSVPARSHFFPAMVPSSAGAMCTS